MILFFANLETICNKEYVSMSQPLFSLINIYIYIYIILAHTYSINEDNEG